MTIVKYLISNVIRISIILAYYPYLDYINKLLFSILQKLKR